MKKTKLMRDVFLIAGGVMAIGGGILAGTLKTLWILIPFLIIAVLLFVNSDY